MAVDEASGAGFDYRPIKSFIIRRFRAAFDQLRPVGSLHPGGYMLGQPIDTPARGEVDAPINAVLKRMPVPAELKIDQFQPVVSDQTIIGTWIVMKIHMEWAWFDHAFGHDSQFFINSQSRLNSGDLRHVAERFSEPIAPIVKRIAFARSQAAASTFELGLLASCELVHSAQCRRERDKHSFGISRISA
jgi:hypothetical protein